ncbi:hypothetical protein Goshw_019638, partial [Gossypium schwendimanii]|nr:hypothetical protein [Gossypium schwendimanii]
NEEFSVRKCSKLLILDGGEDSKFAFDKIWKLKVPPRVRSFRWMLAIDRIPTKKFLVKRGVNLQNLSISCPWCEREVSWKQVDGFEDFYSLCNNVKMAEIRKSFWLISISAACWTAWLVRNGMENFWWISPNRCRIDSIKFKTTASFWRPPPHGCLKFNVCGMANEDRAGCRGVLRDKEGVVRALFSGSAAANDFDVAEIGAMKWLRPWSLQAIFAGIESDIVKAGNVVFSMAEKNGNEMVRL